MGSMFKYLIIINAELLICGSNKDNQSFIDVVVHLAINMYTPQNNH